MTLEYQDINAPIIMSCYAGSCQWNGALDRKYRIPVGQRLAIPANPQSEGEVLFEAIYTSEATVFARTLGAIPAGKNIADVCVESFIPERQIQIIAPNSDAEEEEPTPTPEPVESEEETGEEGDSEESLDIEVLPVLDDNQEDESAEPTPEAEG